MADLFSMPRVEAQDSSGRTLAGAKLEFFITSTSTNLDTYSDDALTTANANPIIADSAGRWGAIFLRDADYKVVLNDSDDVQIWSADPYHPGVDNLADDTIRSTLATTGSANAYALTVNRTLTAYANGDLFAAKANFGCTGAATLNVTGGQSGASALGAIPIKKKHDQDVASGDIENGQWLVLKYDGTNMQLLTPVATASYTDPITTRGDLIRGDSSGNVERLALGTSGQVIHSDGTDAAWAALVVGDLPDGAVVQVVNQTNTGVATGTTTMPSDDTIPQNTEGDQYMTLNITPKSTTNILIIEVVAVRANSASIPSTIALFQDSIANALAAITDNLPAVDQETVGGFTHKMTAGTTSAIAFKVRIGANGASTTTFNGSVGGRLLGGVMASSITIWEIAAS